MSKKIRELTQEEKEKAIELYNKGVKKGEIAKKLKIDYVHLKAFFDKEGYKNRKNGIPLEYYESIFKLYDSGLTLKQIHDHYYPQFKIEQINYICREKGITRKTGKVANMNHHYFDIIDTPEKAYWLGLLTADGCVQCRSESGNSWVISLSLMKEDKYLVEQFAKDVKTDLIVKEYINKTGFQRKDGKPHIETRLSLFSTIMANDLKKYGVIPKKSLILENVPSISENLYRHFIRGFFDGNGSVTYRWNKNKKYRTPRIIFYSTYNFCNSLASIISKQLGIIQPKITEQKNAQISLFSYTNFKYIKKIYEYFYKDLTDNLHYCKRKKQLLEELMSEYRDNHVM